MITVNRELLRQACKHTGLRGGDDAGLAVHELLRANDLATKRCTNALVPQAHAQNRQPARKVANRRDRDACFSRRAWAGRHHQPIHLARVQARIQLIQRDLVIAKHIHLRAKLTEILHQVVGEGVVVVHHQDSDPHVRH